METVGLIGNIVSAVLLPLLGVFMFYDSRRRKASAEAGKAETENITAYATEWKELYEKKERKVEELNGKIDRLYEEKEQDRKEMRELKLEISDLQLKNQALEFLKCDIALRCTDRVPPNRFMHGANVEGKKV